MSDNYKELYERARDLESELKDRIDNSNSPLSGELKERAHRLKEDAESGRDPDNLAQQAKDLSELLRKVADMPNDGQRPMDSGNADELHEQYLELREDFRAIEG